MKKTVSFFLSFVLLLSAVFCVPGFSASAAVYKPDRKLYSQAYMLLSLDDQSFPVADVPGFSDQDRHHHGGAE